jgi:hypothetical protein
MNFTGTTGRKLKAYTSGAREKIKNTYAFKINAVIQNIEQTFPRKISCGTRL